MILISNTCMCHLTKFGMVGSTTWCLGYNKYWKAYVQLYIQSLRVDIHDIYNHESTKGYRESSVVASYILKLPLVDVCEVVFFLFLARFSRSSWSRVSSEGASTPWVLENDTQHAAKSSPSMPYWMHSAKPDKQHKIFSSYSNISILH